MDFTANFGSWTRNKQTQVTMIDSLVSSEWHAIYMSDPHYATHVVPLVERDLKRQQPTGIQLIRCPECHTEHPRQDALERHIRDEHEQPLAKKRRKVERLSVHQEMIRYREQLFERLLSTVVSSAQPPVNMDCTDNTPNAGRNHDEVRR